jgi:S-adenosylmethionine-diacylglycerol 3-amino-3-carboxypropyl transferase
MAPKESSAGWPAWRSALPNEVEQLVNFSSIRYAQCWEDADVLLEALDIQPGSTCLSIASAGDNALAMLSRAPRKVVAIDISRAQLAALELRVAAFRELTHPELLALIGSVDGYDRPQLYHRCRRHLSPVAQCYWDERAGRIQCGIGSAGRFEDFFRIFRTRVLPLIHSHRSIERMLANKPRPERDCFYESEWNTVRWRLFFRLFFSRFILGKLGRDPEFFRYAEGPVAERILHRARYAMTELDPAANPYLTWIFKGRHSNESLPFCLRAENFEAIRANLDRLEWRCCSLDRFLERSSDNFDAFNLSDVFEYISLQGYEHLLRRLIQAAKPGARLAYWNFLVPRRRPDSLATFLKPLGELSDSLFRRDKAFFYSDFVLEEVL